MNTKIGQFHMRSGPDPVKRAYTCISWKCVWQLIVFLDILVATAFYVNAVSPVCGPGIEEVNYISCMSY